MRELTPDGAAGRDVDGGGLGIRVRRLDAELPLPRRVHADDAGADLFAVDDLTLAPGACGLVGTGVAMEIPTGWVGLVHPRSGLAARHGITVLNAPGTIDAGYRGEIKVNLVNLGAEEVVLRRGDRIAQILFMSVPPVRFVEADVLSDTLRGDTGHGDSGGFGSGTG
ncbi:dUTP diphosphatase [Mobilicoccus pelagius]|uniref:Deoxyuridine 5'-triphosphate nucleotidohydrolase n=1 Tax=Mobilicoccus pelagius NBRC 104925 TaxID=1089455 RepID=H5UUM6_9MICO|nr:dUTP diphosphatase [Mobilicoccus pelagius]GAB49434.1 deoxyuridine 5'-triphosphate nucleotidohydrolase [Mobilicoccus pelagius NBRC 104925]